MSKISTNSVKAEYDKKNEKEHYYRLNVVLPKELRPIIDQAAAAAGKSKNSLIRSAILEKIEREK